MIVQGLGAVYQMSGEGVLREDLEEALLILNIDIFLQRIEQNLLGQIAFILKFYLYLGREAFEDGAKV